MDCRICGSSKTYLLYRQGFKDQFEFYKCSQCKLVNLNLQHGSNLENQSKYATDYHPPVNYESDGGAFASYAFASKHVPEKGSYLDIGCGYGSVLYFFKRNGWKVRGLELSSSLADHVKQTLDIHVDVSDFLQFTSHRRQFDLVSLRHVLEHLPDSNLALAKIAGLLKRHGHAHFEFPNINSLTHRLQRLRNRFGKIRKIYKPSYVPGHCNEFSKASFRFLLEKNGFKLIRWETYSVKPIPNFLYNYIHIGTKARAIVQKLN